ncbi:hypothetical protein SDC9_80403 [bioreactor metagenome]|uniref:Uncharacterized protein n=1 Tax=bioreactor metagenome TaxID=1076179 RepID=A0A644YZC1_9ZZZZ
MGKLIKEGRYQADNQQRGKYHAQRGNYTAKDALLSEAHERGNIHRDRAGGTLADCKAVGQLRVADPSLAGNNLTLQDGQHGVAAAEGAHAHQSKGQKQIQQKRHQHSSSSWASHRAATASEGMRQSPRGDRVTEPTLGPSGRQERLNCWEKKRR